MVNVARTTWRLHPDRLDATAGHLVDRMSRQVVVQLRVAVNAFVDRDPSWAAALADMDDTTDELERRLFRHVLEVDGGAPVDEHRLNARGAARLGRAPLRTHRRPRGDDRRAGALRGDR